ncbi:MAG: hypothetical protein ACE5I3_02760 [Phycisphaerae bacterium]
MREVDIVSDCLFLIHRELWQRLGGFDPGFFMYGEEADLCLRARQLGARPVTGAAPGYVGLRLGKLLGAQTIWIDSIANVERLSLSGERIARHADLWLTRWPHLARSDRPSYLGGVLWFS